MAWLADIAESVSAAIALRKSSTTCQSRQRLLPSKAGEGDVLWVIRLLCNTRVTKIALSCIALVLKNTAVVLKNTRQWKGHPDLLQA